MKLERRADAERNKAAVLATTITLLREMGPDVTIDAIASRAGLGAGTVIRSFGSKAKLLDEAISSVMQPISERIAHAVDDRDAIVELRSLLGALGHFHQEHRVLVIALEQAGVELEQVNVACQQVIARVWGLVEQGQRAGRVRADATPIDVLALLHAIAQVAERFDGAQLDRFIAIVVDGLARTAPDAGSKPRARSSR